MNNVCTWNNCINKSIEQIDIAVNNWEPTVTTQDYKTLEYEGNISDIIYCCFDKPKSSFDVYATINNSQVCIGTLNIDGKVTLGTTSKCSVCNDVYSWTRTMSKIICDCDCTSLVAYTEPAICNDSVQYAYYNSNCICAYDAAGCPIYNPDCIVTKEFTPGVCNDVTTCIYYCYVTERFYNMFSNNISAVLNWSKAGDVNEYLGYTNICDQINAVYNTNCDPTITEYKSSMLCRQYCCVRCIEGLYGKVTYPYKLDNKDLVLTESCLESAPIGNATLEGYCYLNCIHSNIDVYNMDCWTDNRRCLNSKCCLICANFYQPTFGVVECSDNIFRWDSKNCWKYNMDNPIVIDANPNSWYFGCCPIHIVCTDKCLCNNMISYNKDCYKYYLSKLKGLYSIEKTACICMYNSICNESSYVISGIKWGVCRASIIYCVVTSCICCYDISNCCIHIKEFYV